MLTALVAISRYIVIYCQTTTGRRNEGGEMCGRGMMGYAGGRRAMAPYGRPFSPRFPVGLVVGGLFLLFVVGPAFHFFPFFLILAVPFLRGPRGGWLGLPRPVRGSGRVG